MKYKMKWYSPLVLSVFMFWLAYVNPHIWIWFVTIGFLLIFYSYYIVNIRDKDIEEVEEEEISDTVTLDFT